MQKWGSLSDLADYSGMSPRMLAYIRKDEPSVLVFREKGKRLEFDLGACNANLRKRERDKALKDAEPQDFEDAKTRKMAAEARLAELDLETKEGRLLDVETTTKTVEAYLTQLRSQLITAPQRHAPAMVGMKSIPEATMKLEAMCTELMGALSNGHSGD